MAAEAKWYYGRGGQQFGPETQAELQALISRGEVVPTDLVWREGMPKWIPAGESPELTPVSSVAASPTVPQPAQPMHVPYYGSNSGIPERAILNLRGHARPAGDTGDWPLDDARIAQFEATLKLRKKVIGAASLYRGLLLLSVISFAIIIPIIIFASLSTGPNQHALLLTQILMTALLAGFCLLYFFASQATRRSKRWAPLTMFIIFLASGLLNVFSIVLTNMGQTGSMNGAANAGVQLVGVVVVVALSAAFAIVSWRAYSAIPRYLAQPAWCQELIVKAAL